MTIDKDKLRALAETLINNVISSCSWAERIDGSELFRRDMEFARECSPEVIMTLLGEIERLERKNANQVESIREYQDLAAGGERLGELRADLRVTKGERDELKAENEKFDEGMRSLAFQLSAGGYNAETLTAEQLVGKVTDGLASFAESSGRLLDQVRAERDALRSQVATLQAEPNSYQSGYDAGRAAEKAHADNWREEAARLKDQAATLKRDADRFQFIAQDAESSLERIYGDNWLGALDCLMGADKEASHD